MNVDEFNGQLAKACRACHSACCKKGLLFITDAEHAAIAASLASTDPTGLAEFLARCTHCHGFHLYDQKERCQFLDAQDYCRLHVSKLKPTECFWWPYNIYKTDGRFEIRISTSCCDGHKAHSDTSPYPRWIAHKANAIGLDVISAFRDAYKGSYENRLISPVLPLSFGYIGIDGLPAYRRVGEQLFPSADWNQGMARYTRLLALFPNGINAARIGDDLVAYLTLWPVTTAFLEGFAAGTLSDINFDTNALDRSALGRRCAWYITALAILSDVPELRAMLRRFIYTRVHNCLAENPGASVFAEIATPEGERFLRRLGFAPVLGNAKVFSATAATLTPPHRQ